MNMSPSGIDSAALLEVFGRKRPTMRARNAGRVGIPIAAAFLLLNIVSAQPAVSQILYTVYELGALCSEGISFAQDIDNSGRAVGRSGYITDSDTRAVRWTAAGVESLGTLPGG